MVWWRDLRDENPENRVAGNVDDLLKHGTYFAVLSYLLGQSPWRQALRLRECHAGRGLYAVPAEDPRRRGISVVVDTSLGRAQREALRTTGADEGGYYAGSALLCSWLLDQHEGAHQYEAYEWDPRTREILRAAVGAERVLGSHDDERFDGESHIATELEAWSEQDVVFMDPFGVWDREKHANRRERYARIFAALEAHSSRPVWLLYLTWRNALVKAPLPAWTRQPRIEIAWDSGVPCALWVAPPPAHLDGLRVAIEDVLGGLSVALERAVDVTILSGEGA